MHIYTSTVKIIKLTQRTITLVSIHNTPGLGVFIPNSHQAIPIPTTISHETDLAIPIPMGILCDQWGLWEFPI